MNTENTAAPPIVLTIAGSDSGGGAGIEADLKSITMLGCYGAAAITAVTAQNTVGVQGIHYLPPEFVAHQITAVLSDIGAQAIKTGMLGNAPIVRAVAEALGDAPPMLVIDPVMVAKSGDALLLAEGRAALIEALLPKCLLVTPNIPEAEVLAEMRIDSESALRTAGARIHALGAQQVLMKGGHLDTPGEAVDYLYDGDCWRTFPGVRYATRNTHGTGCTFSAAIAAHLAQGADTAEAVAKAKDYLSQAIRRSFSLGQGHGPLNHLWPLG